LQTASGSTLVGSLQHGGGFGGGGRMASSANGAAKVKACMGNVTGTLKPKTCSAYNAGLHDCNTSERVQPADYTKNLLGVFETLRPAASATVFVLTTPYDMPQPIPHPAGINMSCVIQYNAIAREVAAKVGAVVIDDLYAYAEAFCQAWPDEPASTGHGGNYTNCAIQTAATGLHYFTAAPLRSGQQYTALSVASTLMKLIPEAEIQNKSTTAELPSLHESLVSPQSCGDPPSPLNKSLPNVLVIGDSISEQYISGLQNILGHPRPQQGGKQTGALASVQHNGNTGNRQAGPTTNGAACIDSWVGTEKWDVITMNFGIHDCCAGGDGRLPGKIVNKTDYVNNLEHIYNVAKSSLA